MKRKNILLIIPNLSFGGAQVSFAKLSAALSRQYNVINVVFNKDDIAKYDLGGELISLDIPASGNWFSKLYYFWKRVFKLRKLKKAYNIDCAISFLEGADYVNVLSKRNEKVILSIRGSKQHDQNIKGLLGIVRHKILIPFFYDRASLIAVLNKGVKQELEKVYRINKPISVIYNGFDIADISEKARQSISEQEEAIFDRPVIISHGRLAIEKGYNFLIEAFNAMKNKANVRLVIIGDGPEKERLINLALTCDLQVCDWSSDEICQKESQVVFLGYKTNPYKYLKHASVFVLSSLHEGFGNSLAEAMACGLPVVSADCPYGPGEILNPKGDCRDKEKFLQAQFGILAPPFTKSNSQLNWSKYLDSLLENKAVLDRYSILSKTRIGEFEISAKDDQWREEIGIVLNNKV